MRGARHVALVGLSGTGKSTLAPLVAGRTARVSVDLDDVVAAGAGRSVADVFAIEGEAGFRRRELAALTEVLQGAPSVIATGGGVVTTPAVRELLQRHVEVVWLRAATADLLERLAGHTEQRPLLAGDAAAALSELARVRDPLYAEVADVVVEVGTRSPESVMASILTALGAPVTEEQAT